MLLEALALDAIVAKILERARDAALDAGQDRVKDLWRERLGHDPVRQAVRQALAAAYDQFTKQHPEAPADGFDAGFLEHEAAPILAALLQPDGRPDASALAAAWADSLNVRPGATRTAYTSQYEPAAADFLDAYIHALKAAPALRDATDSRALDSAAADLAALRAALAGQRATPGTCRDYLAWVAGRHLYLDARGTLQTQRRVQVKLEDVYIGLRAARDDAPTAADRRLLEQELAALDAKWTPTPEEALADENERERLRDRWEARHEHPAADPRAEVLELSAVVGRHDRAVILGDPGSGKSTLLRFLALQHALAGRAGRPDAGADLGPARLPIFVRIADYVDQPAWRAQALSAFLPDACRRHECPAPGLADLLAGTLDRGEALILLDGLDEIVSPDDRRAVVEKMEDFVRVYAPRGNRFVVTSRVAGYRTAPLGEGFAHYLVQEMDDAQIRGFLERWCAAVEAAGAPDAPPEERAAAARREIEGILQAVKTNPGVRRLAANPLLLRILALIHRNGAHLPQKRIELYRLAADTLARDWRVAQGVPETALKLLEDANLTRLLGELAYWLHAERPTGLATEAEVFAVLGPLWAPRRNRPWDPDDPDPDVVADLKSFLQTVREHTGLFVERAPRRYGFMHLTFEEYYAARHLVARSKTRARLIRHHLHDPRWDEPILLGLGFVGLESADEAADLFATAILAEGEDAVALGFTPSPYEDLLGRDFLFALRCLSDDIPVAPSVLRALVARLADERLGGRDRAQFTRYREALEMRISALAGTPAGSELSRLLVAALRDPERDVRKRAAAALGGLVPLASEAIDALLQAADDSEEVVRYAALLSLNQVGAREGPEVVARLPRAAGDSEQPVGVPTVRNPDAARAVDMLRKAAGDFERAVPFMAGGSLAPVVPVAPLLWLAADSVGTLRYIMAWSLEPVRTPGRSESVTALISAAGDSEAALRYAAVDSLGRIEAAKGPEAVATLLVATADPEWAVRVAAARSLGQVGAAVGPEGVAALLRAAGDSETTVRIAAVGSLGQVGTALVPEGVVALLRAAGDSEGAVRIAAVKSLGEAAIRDVPGADDALVQCLTDRAPDVQHRAAIILADQGQRPLGLISGLLDILAQAGDWKDRRRAAEMLGRLGGADEPIVTALLAGLLDSDDDVRTACAGALATLGMRFPGQAPMLIAWVQQALADPQLKAPDLYRWRSSQGYAYDALWMLVAGEGPEGGAG